MFKKFVITNVLILSITLILPYASQAADAPVKSPSSSLGKKALYIGGGALGGAAICLGAAELIGRSGTPGVAGNMGGAIIVGMSRVVCPLLGAAIGAGAGALTEALVERHDAKMAITGESVKLQSSAPVAASRQPADATSNR